MIKTRLVIGPFRRRAFAEALATSVGQDPWISASVAENETEVVALLDSQEPVVLILEQHGDDSWRRFVPTSEFVSVILIAEEGRGDVQVSLRSVGLQRLRAAIGLLAETAHPKLCALGEDIDFTAAPLRDGSQQGLASVVAWLDAAFALVLDRHAEARGQPGDVPWMQDLAYLRRHFARGQAIGQEVERDRFRAMVGQPCLERWLIEPFGLSSEELRLLGLVAAPELDKRYGQAVGLLQNDYAQPRPSATALAMFLSDDHVGADITAMLAGSRPFARLRLIRTTGDGPQAGFEVPAEVLGLFYGVRRCAGLNWWIQSTALDPDPQLATDLDRILSEPMPPLIFGGSGEPHAADEVAAAAVRHGPVLRVDCAAAGAAAVDCLPDWVLAGRSGNAVLLLEGLNALPPSDQSAILSSDLGELLRGQIVVGATARSRREQPRGAVTIAVPKPSSELTATRWRSALAAQGLEITRMEADEIGSTLRLTPSEISDVGSMVAGALRLDAAEPCMHALREAARTVAARHAPETVRRPPCIFGWEDIVLPPAIRSMVQSIPDHVRLSSLVLDQWGFAARLPYGRGVGAMFSGPSGTGKTMCAQIIAQSLGVELMQVELSRCVSKYIGETEKNIDRCFVAAETSSAALLFDEADALFGKRTEIKDAHDRHANVEVAYLLQRIEAFEGLVILTTNLRSNIDQAFLRRLRFCVEFPMPGATDRARIWSLAIPHGARLSANVDTTFLASRLPLSGGSIQAIAVNAAFAAAADDSAEIDMHHIMLATRAELIKNGMLSAERDLPEPALAALEEQVV